MFCLNCGYPLKAPGSITCPDCGHAFDPADTSTFSREPRPSHYRTILRWTRRVAVVAFVTWHLLVFVLANAKIRAGPIANAVWHYEFYLSLDQSWGMFTSPLWKKAPFPGARITFDDGTVADVLSPNEPRDMTRFMRNGGWRYRKLEHHLAAYDLRGTYQEPMQRRLVEAYARRWREENPNDLRRPVSVTFIVREFRLPPPSEPWPANPAPKVTEQATYPLTP